MWGRSWGLGWTRGRVCCRKKEVRGTREEVRKRESRREGNIFSKMKVKEKGRYAQTGGEEGGYTDRSSRLRTRSTGDDPPDGDRTERVGMGAGAD
jgi:hypothetical protein